MQSKLDLFKGIIKLIIQEKNIQIVFYIYSTEQRNKSTEGSLESLGASII